MGDKLWPWLCPYPRGHSGAITAKHGKYYVPYEILLLPVLFSFSRPHYLRKGIEGFLGVLHSIMTCGINCMIQTMHSQRVQYLDNTAISTGEYHSRLSHYSTNLDWKNLFVVSLIIPCSRLAVQATFKSFIQWTQKVPWNQIKDNCYPCQFICKHACMVLWMGIGMTHFFCWRVTLWKTSTFHAWRHYRAWKGLKSWIHLSWWPSLSSVYPYFWGL